MPYIISVLLFVTHGQNTLLPINTFFVFVFVLLTLCSFHPFFFISSYFRSVWHPFSCFILRMFFFFNFVLPLLGLHIFHHVHPTL